ncbi:hypothetical protein GP486_001277 [Trichoglossum hirsutum]|uniref:Uncharacterized protein n=1 Tax=Trichoglossum hirsutum TaxID=265104 RepID=A0A9P8RSS0_9PEZI|nr:hypothetical protein GP486_001277 [Trichoglossum hirsutum]
MDIPSSFQEEIDWVFDHASSREAAESQAINDPEFDFLAEPPYEIERAQAAPNRSRRLSDHVIWNSVAPESDPFQLDILTKPISNTVDLTKDSGIGWELTRKNKQVSEMDTLEGHRLAKHTRQANKEEPSKGGVRALDDGLNVFHSNSNVPVRIKKRREYGPERRKEVSEVRGIAACIQCRFRKKTSGTNLLLHPRRGAEIIRQDGLMETIYISAVGSTEDVPVLEVSVTKAQLVERAWNSCTGTYETRQYLGYMLAPNALPSSESLIRFAMERLFFVVDRPRGTASRICDKVSGDWFIAPSAINSQLEALIGKLVGDVERGFVRELERVVLDTSSGTRNRVLTLFLSVWILGHVYAFFAAVSSAYGDRKEKEFFDYMNRLSCAIRHARFRSSHPLDEVNWSKIPDYTIIGNDPTLLKTMSEIRAWEKGKYRPDCVPW